MNENIFDKHYGDYNKVLADSLGLSSDDKCDFFDNYKIDIIAKQFDNGRAYRILDFGCGIGKLSVLLSKKYAKSQIIGYDLSEKTLNYARERNTSIPNLAFVSAVSDDQKFDIVIVSNVFHHVSKPERKDLLLFLAKKLLENGSIVVIEHNPLNPLTRYVVNRCPFDVDADLIRRREFVDIAEECGLEVSMKKYVLMFPWSPVVFRKIERLFENIPVGAQYALVLNKLSPGAK